jgi:hypothetical protein
MGYSTWSMVHRLWSIVKKIGLSFLILYYQLWTMDHGLPPHLSPSRVKLNFPKI